MAVRRCHSSWSSESRAWPDDASPLRRRATSLGVLTHDEFEPASVGRGAQPSWRARACLHPPLSGCGPGGCRRIDARRLAGISLGPLDGAIVSIKDLFDVAGEVTLAGSRALRNATPAGADAAIVRRLRQAGAVIIGRTNMVEFAFSGLGLNPHTGTPGNAADPSLIPGGSSSGAGVSVALGSSEIAIGSDTGGSVTNPGFAERHRRVQAHRTGACRSMAHSRSHTA
ncbi:hypothetical protein JNW90_17590 [Micromonospora sp. STR1s_5]|nr:hypothetical protein [Micromonospora sp. STR1s_5]